MAAADNKVAIYLGPPLRQALDVAPGASGSRSGRLNAVAERYLETVRRSMPALHLDEWCALCDMLNASLRDAQLARALDIEMADALQDGLAEKWRIDGAALARKIAAMPFAERIAIIEVVDRYWSAEGHETHEERIRAAGAKLS